MSGFAGKWVDDQPAGKSNNFDNFVKAIELTEKEIAEWKDYVGGQVTTVVGDKWSHTYEYGEMSKTNHFKMNVTSPKDTDLEGNEIEISATFDPKTPNKMVEITKTWMPKKLVTTKLERTLNDAGDKQTLVLTHLDSGVAMDFTQSKVPM